jgi:hypothetical protein
MLVSTISLVNTPPFPADSDRWKHDKLSCAHLLCSVNIWCDAIVRTPKSELKSISSLTVSELLKNSAESLEMSHVIRFLLSKTDLRAVDAHWPEDGGLSRRKGYTAFGLI